ncbi:ABSCISIC ACID-INSENSITIVE 5-like protein 2 [Linum grandiflorum]
MGSNGDGRSNGAQSHLQPLGRQNSLYNLTLDEVQSQLGDLGKPFSSMNLDELLRNVWTAEANQVTGTDAEGIQMADNQTSLQRQGSLSIAGALSKKTVDEVWRDIQQSKNNGERKSKDRQPTLGEMTLEDFLAKAGVVGDESIDNNNRDVPIAGSDANVVPRFPQQGQWLQYQHAQFQHPQHNVMGMFMPGQPVPQPVNMGAGSVMDVAYPENPVPIAPPPIIGTLSDSQTVSRKRGAPDEIVVKNVERRQKRMIKNRESAARSRARKQAYTNELENKISRLEEENERLRKLKELENILPSAPAAPEPRYQLRRTSSSPF